MKQKKIIASHFPLNSKFQFLEHVVVPSIPTVFTFSDIWCPLCNISIYFYYSYLENYDVKIRCNCSVSTAHLIFMLACSHPYLINSGICLRIFPNLFSTELFFKWRFGTSVMPYRHCFLKSNAEQRTQRHTFESKAMDEGGCSHFWERESTVEEIRSGE